MEPRRCGERRQARLGPPYRPRPAHAFAGPGADLGRSSIMEVSPLVWGLTIAAIGGLLLFDFVFHVRLAHAPTLGEAAIWSALYVGLALLFGVGVVVFGGTQTGSEYFAGY